MLTTGSIPFKKRQQYINQKPLVQKPAVKPNPTPAVHSQKPLEEQSLEEGHQDFIKETVKENEKNVEKLDSLSELADFVFFKTKTTNPIDPFPDEVIIDSNKVSIVYNYFFWSGRVHSVMINNVSDVFIDMGIFFAKLGIVDKGFVENTVEVEYLSKKDAIRIRRLIQGLVVAHQHGVNISKLKQDLDETEIIEKIEKLGKARTGDTE